MSLSKHASISPASAIGNNEDLMTCIFLQLPVKSVLKCRCVCKQWQSIASNPQFCHQHASLHGQNPSPSALLFQRGFDNTSDFEFCSLTGNNHNSTTRIASFDYLNVPRNANLSLLSSCNGLLLFQSANFPHPRKFYVCNPTTKKFTTLALPNYLPGLQLVDAVLAFDPCVSPHYKVVFLWMDLRCRYCIAIYSSETKTCGKLSNSLPSNCVRVLEGSGIFCNGKIYWHVHDRETSLLFDVGLGCLDVFQLPPWYRLCQPIHCFGASRGRLYAVLHGHENTDVYELNEDASGWFVKYRIGFRIENLMLCYLCEEQDEGSTLLQYEESESGESGYEEPGKIVAYNLKEKTTNKVCDLNPLSNDNDRDYGRFNRLYETYKWCGGAYQWIETLSCV